MLKGLVIKNISRSNGNFGNDALFHIDAMMALVAKMEFVFFFLPVPKLLWPSVTCCVHFVIYVNVVNKGQNTET